MAGRLAIDFGTCNTRLAVWDEGEQRARRLMVPEISVAGTALAEEAEAEPPWYIPSLIHYDGEQVLIGKQVRDHGRLEHEATFRWMKRYIADRLNLPRRVGQRTIGIFEAGADFLATVLNYAASMIDFQDEEVAFTVPVEAFEHYQNWLTTVCERAGIRRYTLLDEPSAAALGYGVHLQPNDVFMVFDFGGGTLDTSIVRIGEQAKAGKRCTVVGKAGCDLGGTSIDTWLYQDVLRRNHKAPEDVRHLGALLMLEAERVKEELSSREKAELTVTDPETGAVLFADYTRGQFEDLLEQKGLFWRIQRTVDTALARARERGYEREHLKAVLLVGGCSLMPCVRRAVRQVFGEIVQPYRPLEAVAFGAAAHVGGASIINHIQHDYGLRFYNREKGDYDYRVIVSAGTPYPTPTGRPLCRLTVKATHEGQRHLGLEIYELGRSDSVRQAGEVELVYDESGRPRVVRREESEVLWRQQIGSTEFISADPPAAKGDPRFEVSFTVDRNKFLCVTVMDRKANRTLYRDHPLVKLT